MAEENTYPEVGCLILLISTIFISIFLYDSYCYYLAPITVSENPSTRSLNDRRFESYQWKRFRSNKNEKPKYELPGEMVYSLLNDVELVGKTKSELKSILGEPDYIFNEAYDEELSSEFCYAVLLKESYDKCDLHFYNLCVYFDLADTTRLVLFGRT